MVNSKNDYQEIINAIAKVKIAQWYNTPSCRMQPTIYINFRTLVIITFC